MLRKPFFWIAVWLVFLSLGPITILRDTPWQAAFNNRIIVANFLQRITGTVAFTMIFFQIVLGSLMPKLVEKFGPWIFKFHITEGPIAYALIVTHPLLYLLFHYFSVGRFDPIYVFLGFCVLCQTRAEFFYTFGRVGFWLVSVAVLAAELRIQPWWRDHWRKFHVLNYFIFFLVALHSYFVGTDSHFPPFVYFWWFAVIIVSGISIYKLWGLSRKPSAL